MDGTRKNIIPSEVTQTLKFRCSMFFLICKSDLRIFKFDYIANIYKEVRKIRKGPLVGGCLIEGGNGKLGGFFFMIAFVHFLTMFCFPLCTTRSPNLSVILVKGWSNAPFHLLIQGYFVSHFIASILLSMRAPLVTSYIQLGSLCHSCVYHKTISKLALGY